MWRATIRALLAHKGRMVATATAVVLAVSFMAGTMVLTDTMGRTFDDLFDDVYSGTDAVVRSAQTIEARDFGPTSRGHVDAALLAQVRAVDGVAAAEGSIEGYARIVDEHGDPLGDPGRGAPTFGFNWSDNERLNVFRLAEGRAPRHHGELVVDRLSAKRAKLRVGRPATVLVSSGPERFTVVGIATFGRADSPGGATVAMFTEADAERYVGEPGKYTQIGVVARPGVSQQELRSRLAAALPKGVEVVTGKQITAEAQDDFQQAVGFFSVFLLTFAAIALFVGSFLIYNTFSIVVAQRGRELALLRALGAGRGQVFRSVLGEATVMGLAASLVGVFGGIGVAGALKGLLAAFGMDVPAGGVVVSGKTVAVAVMTGLGVTLLASLMPAWRAARLPPMAALRDLGVDTSSGSRRRVAVGAVVVVVGIASLAGGLVGGEIALVGLGAAAVFLGVAVLGPVIARPVSRLIGAPVARTRGITGVLARENAARSPKRTAATASALMIGVGLVAFITITASSARASITEAVDRAFPADLVVASDSFGAAGGLSPSLAERLRRLPDVDLAMGLRLAMLEIDGKGKFALAADPSQMAQLFDLEVTRGSLARVSGPHGMAVQEDVAEKEGWKVGDEVEVRFAETGRQSLEIGAVYREDTVAGNYFVSQDVVEANMAEQYDLMVQVRFVDGVDARRARAEVQRVVDRYPGAKVQDRSEFKDAQASQLDQMLNLVYALLLLALVIALIGIANTLALSILERTREIGLLRAVGATRGQVRSMVRWESVLIALLGTLLGLGVGIFFSWSVVQALRDQGFTSYRVPFGNLVGIMVAAGVLGVIAGVAPARRAARLDVLRAVTVE